MNDSGRPTSLLAPWLVSLLLGTVSGFLGGWSALWWHQKTPDAQPLNSSASLSSSDSHDELERRIGELEEACSVALRQPARPSANSRAQPEPAVASPTSSGSRVAEAGPALEAAVRDVLTRLEDEEYQSREARRNQREEGRIRGFVSVLAQRAGFNESTSNEIAAVLIAKREELRAEKDSLLNSAATASLTPKGRKDKRRLLEEKMNTDLERALLEVLGPERLETYRAVAKEEHFELGD